MSHYTFGSRISYGDLFDTGFTESAVKNEPMLFDCDFETAWREGGPITHSFLARLPRHWTSGKMVFDSRVHMLMEGWYPCIPGYHHDDVPRGADGQPNYKNPGYRAEHAMGLINGDICPTVFAIGEATVPVNVGSQPIYRRWHLEIERQLNSGILTPRLAPSGRVVFFDCDTFHSGTKAIAPGWRWFGRASKHTDRTKAPRNEIRRQVQVYLDNHTEGW